MILTESSFRSLRKAFKISPFLLVSSLTTKASTSPSITAGPKSSSNFTISKEQSGNFSHIIFSRFLDLRSKLFVIFLSFFEIKASDVRPIIILSENRDCFLD